MRFAQPYSAQKQNPLLYWTTLIYLVGVPNFIHFDVTGRTHSQGTFNLTSISEIIIALASAYVLTMVVLLGRQPLLVRKVNFAAKLWIPLLLVFLVATALQPASHLTPPSTTGPLISLYRIFEWILGFALILALYSRTPVERATEMIVQLIGRMSWIWMAIVWIMLPIMPTQVYGDSADIPSGVKQLGGELISPSYLSTMAIAAFLYAMFFRRGPIRLVGCAIAGVTLVLAHTRIEQMSLLLILLAYALFFSGKPLLRLITIVSMAAAGAMAALFQATLLEYLARGQSLKSLTTLNDRTRVWQASLEAAQDRLLLGYGFVAGARNAIRDHWNFAHWIPPHAHNEYIHALVSGGVLAAVLVICIYGRALWTAFRATKRGPNHVYLALLMILFTVRSIGGSNFTIAYTRVGAVFLLTFIGILAASDLPKRIRRRRLQNAPEHSVLQEVGA